MKMMAAIAYSPGNKADTFTDNGRKIIVQHCYSSLTEQWLHVWHFDRDEIRETDIPLSSFETTSYKNTLKVVYYVDPDADYWSVVK